MVKHILLKLDNSTFNKLQKTKQRREKELGLKVTWEAFFYNASQGAFICKRLERGK